MSIDRLELERSFNREEVPQAVEFLLEYTDRPHIIPIRGLVSAAYARKYAHILDGTGYDEFDPLAAQADLYNDVPNLEMADKVIANFWLSHGYTDYALANPQLGGNVEIKTQRHFVPHLDGAKKAGPATNTLWGPVTMPVCLTGPTRYKARRLPVNLKREDGSLNIKRYRDLGQKADLLIQGGEEITLGPTDGGLFTVHPYTTAHEIHRVGWGRRQGLAFDNHLTKKT